MFIKYSMDYYKIIYSQQAQFRLSVISHSHASKSMHFVTRLAQTASLQDSAYTCVRHAATANANSVKQSRFISEITQSHLFKLKYG